MYWKVPLKGNEEITNDEMNQIRNWIFALHGYLSACAEDKTMTFFYPQIKDIFKNWNNCVVGIFVKDEYKEAGKIK